MLKIFSDSRGFQSSVPDEQRGFITQEEEGRGRGGEKTRASLSGMRSELVAKYLARANKLLCDVSGSVKLFISHHITNSVSDKRRGTPSEPYSKEDGSENKKDQNKKQTKLGTTGARRTVVELLRKILQKEPSLALQFPKLK